MNICEAVGYIISKLIDNEKPISLEFSNSTQKGTKFVSEEEKGAIFITIPEIDVEICVHNAGVNLKILETSKFAHKFTHITETEVAVKMYRYSNEKSDAQVLDKVINFIENL